MISLSYAKAVVIGTHQSISNAILIANKGRNFIKPQPLHIPIS